VIETTALRSPIEGKVQVADQIQPARLFPLSAIVHVHPRSVIFWLRELFSTDFLYTNIANIVRTFEIYVCALSIVLIQVDSNGNIFYLYSGDAGAGIAQSV
jgi:hypothetical protein